MIKSVEAWKNDEIEGLINKGYIPFSVNETWTGSYIWLWKGGRPPIFDEIEFRQKDWGDCQKETCDSKEEMNKQDIKSKERYEVIYIDKHAQVRNIPFDNMEELLASYSIIYGDDEIAVIGVFRVSTTLHFEEVMKRTHFQGEGRCTEL